MPGSLYTVNTKCGLPELQLYNYYFPLINVVTDLPNEGVVVYQTALILIGAYITYRTLFRAQKKKKDVHIINCRVKENKISQ